MSFSRVFFLVRCSLYVPPIAVVAARCLLSWLQAGVTSGFGESGINVSTAKNGDTKRITVSVRSSGRLEVPLAEQGRLLIDPDGPLLRHLVKRVHRLF